MTIHPDTGDDRRKVLDATDIVRLIGEHVTLRPKGREFAGLCPFHDDHTPSMCVVPHKQMFHCFSCGTGGNAIDFMMKRHSMGFVEALRILADRAGVTLTQRRREAEPAESGPRVSRDELAQANRMAWDFFRAIYRHESHGAVARAMVERRGISPEMMERFGIGASPDRWDGLVRFIESKDLPLEAFEGAGLIKRRGEGAGGGTASGGGGGGAPTGGYYDTFRNRLMFPIFDQIGRPIAFGARKLRDEDEPKYLNSPETPLFQKSSTLYGLHAAGDAIRSSRTAVITEGYTDVIACHQGGFENVVAALGTAFTARHVAALRRLCDRVVLLFDGDDAGERAAERACEVFFAEGLDVDVAMLPDSADPDDLLKKDGGRDRFAAVLSDSEPAIEFQIRRLRDRMRGRGLAPGSMAWAREIEDQITKFAEMGLADLPPIRRQTVIRRLAGVAGVDASVIVEAVAAARSGGRRRHADPESGTGEAGHSAKLVPKTPTEHAFSLLLARPELAREFASEARDIVESLAYGSGPLAGIAGGVGPMILERTPSSGELLSMIDDPAHRNAAAGLIADLDRSTEGDAERQSKMWRDCVRRAGAESLGGESVSGVAGERNSLVDAGALLEQCRTRHQSLGGNPLARPRVVS